MSKIIGNTVGTTMLRPNWAETDEKSSAYIGNKPTADDGNFLVGNGKGNLKEMTPAEVLSHINGASVATLTTAEYDALVEAEQTNANVLYMLTDADEEEYALKSDLDDYAKKGDIPSVEGLASTDYVDTKVAGIVNSAPEALNTLNELASALGNDENFATTVAQQIGEKADKEHGHPEYVTETELTNKKYLSEVKPEDVIFDYNLIITQPVGRITEDVLEENNGAVTLETTNQTLKNVFIDLFGGELQPTKSDPSCEFYAHGDIGEVGETFTLPTAIFRVTSVGHYSYNDTGIKFSGSITDGYSTTPFENLVTGQKATVEATGANTYTESPITFNFSGQYSYNEGNTPKTNLGKDSDEVSAIPAVTNEPISTSCTFTGYRKIFAGVMESRVDSFNSRTIRNLGEGQYATGEAKTFALQAMVGDAQVVVAFPTDSYSTATFEYYINNGYTGLGAADIIDCGEVDVYDANGENARAYQVYMCRTQNSSGYFNAITDFRITVK